MKRIGLVLLVIFLFVTITYAQDETITLRTYYPAPYGVYRQLGVLGPAVPGISCVPPATSNFNYHEADTLRLMNIGVPSNTPDAGYFTIPALLQVGGIFQYPNQAAGQIPPDIHRAAIVGVQDVGIVGVGTAPNSGIGVVGIGENNGLQGQVVDEGAENSPDNAAAIMGYFKGGGGAGHENTEYYGIKAEAYRAMSNEVDGIGNPLPKRGRFIGGYFYGDTNAIECDSIGPAIHIRQSQGAILIDDADPYGVKIDTGGNGVNGIESTTFWNAVWAETTNENAQWAGLFRGNVRIESNSNGLGGNLYLTGSVNPPGADISEVYQLLNEEEIMEGDLVVIDPKNPGFLQKSTQPYDTKVAGIISSEEQTGMILGAEGNINTSKPLALAGRVYCNVDTSYGEINPGDSLTTSPTSGYAMKAKPILEINGYILYPQGCIIAKALEGLKEGKGKILVLVCLK